MRHNALRQVLEPDRHWANAVARRGLLLAAAFAACMASASTAHAFQDPISGYQPSSVLGHYQYAKRYYGAISPYPAGFYSYPNYVYGGAIGGYSVGYYPYAFPPPYRAPLWPYAYGYGGWGYGFAGSPYGGYPGWGGAYPYSFGF
jgi:hypothetical protein